MYMITYPLYNIGFFMKYVRNNWIYCNWAMKTATDSKCGFKNPYKKQNDMNICP